MSIPDTMRAVGYRANRPSDDPLSLVDVELPVPEPRPHDLLVNVRAVSVNPVDIRVRTGRPPMSEVGILGYDAAGTVVAVGTDVSRFRIGDEVYYAGSLDRPGSDAEYQTVDERIVGHKPATLTFAEAAALPLTAITAWESLFDKLRLTETDRGTILVIGAAGGTGSMVTQLARIRTGLTVIGTASREESRRWVESLGAQHVVDHRGDLAGNVLAVAPQGIDYIFSPYSPGNVEAYERVLRPGGQIVGIDQAPDINPLMGKSISWHWELMFTRPMYRPEDDYQHRLLDEVAQLVDKGRLRSTLTTELTPFDAATLRGAHQLVESKATIGKVVVAF